MKIQPFFMPKIMKRLITITFFLLALITDSKGIQDSVNVKINVYGINLTEDMSKVSTHNDEILLLIYPIDILDSVIEPLVCSYFIIDAKQKSKSLTWSIHHENKDYILILIELDSENPVKQLEPIFRINLKKIYQAYSNKYNDELESYIGDNELLTIKSFTSPTKKKIEISLNGFSNIDNYHYLITLE